MRVPHLLAYLLKPAQEKPGYYPELWPVQVAAQSSPLARPGAAWTPKIQRAKEVNIALAAAAIHETVLWPGQVFSWHAAVGPPLGWRGYLPGPEMHGAQIGLGRGGGVCAAANLLFWMSLHAGLEVVERHRHAYDLFPDHQRAVPFGAGATVYYPRQDLRLKNPHVQPVVFRMWVEGGRLLGEIRARRPLASRWTVEERGARFVAGEGDEVWRENEIYRITWLEDVRAEEVRVGAHRARVLYPVAAEEIER